MEKNLSAKKEAAVEPTATPSSNTTGQPMQYVGPLPAPNISNLPCGCTLPADQLTLAQQLYLIESNTAAAAWFTA